MDPRATLENMVRIRAKLKEAEQIARESGFDPDPASPEAGSGRANPAGVTVLIDVAIRECDNVISRMGNGGAPTS